jgi:uncharacterized damage-inducible protein DinB
MDTTQVKKGSKMLQPLKTLWEALEAGREALIEEIESFTEDRLRARPGGDQWSILQTLQHLVLAEQGMRASEAELRVNPVREHLRPGKLIGVVRDILVRDVRVKVPHPSLEPDGSATLGDLVRLWEQERQEMSGLLETVTAENSETVMFSHPAAGPMTAAQAMDLTLVHLDHHRRQIERIRAALDAT